MPTTNSPASMQTATLAPSPPEVRPAYFVIDVRVLDPFVRFPSLAHAHAWHDSPAYQSILGHRLASAQSRAFLVEGVA